VRGLRTPLPAKVQESNDRLAADRNQVDPFRRVAHPAKELPLLVDGLFHRSLEQNGQTLCEKSSDVRLERFCIALYRLSDLERCHTDLMLARET
jgi:hypothetical protein